MTRPRSSAEATAKSPSSDLAAAPLGFAEYARDVLPETIELWGNGRSLGQYIADIRAIDRAERKRRAYFTYGVQENGRIVASCKTYERTVRRTDGPELRAVGIGAVFTSPSQRGRGFATVLLGALLDKERAGGVDLAFLYSDIHPAFYERLGFVQFRSRTFRLRTSRLDATRVRHRPLRAEDWPALRRCFHALDDARPWSFERDRAVWTRIRRHWESPAPAKAQRVRLVVPYGREVAAYVAGVRYPRDDEVYILELAFTERGRELVPGLLRAAAGDLRNLTGWVPPAGARETMRGAVMRARRDAVFMVAPLSAQARTWLTAIRETEAAADPTWYADHV